MFIKEKTTKKHIINRKNEKELDVKIQLGAGKLHLQGGTEEVMEGLFTITRDSDAPAIEYEISDKGRGTLIVRQPPMTGWKNLKSAKQEWELDLNGELPIALSVALGAGKSTLELSRLNLVDLHIESGVGETNIDLTGDWKMGFKVKIDSGVGKTKIRLPKHIGIKMNIDKGIGKVNADYFMVVGDSYQNQAYETADVKMELDLDVGVGEVTLEQV